MSPPPGRLRASAISGSGYRIGLWLWHRGDGYGKLGVQPLVRDVHLHALREQLVLQPVWLSLLQPDQRRLFCPVELVSGSAFPITTTSTCRLTTTVTAPVPCRLARLLRRIRQRRRTGAAVRQRSSLWSFSGGGSSVGSGGWRQQRHERRRNEQRRGAVMRAATCRRHGQQSRGKHSRRIYR